MLTLPIQSAYTGTRCAEVRLAAVDYLTIRVLMNPPILSLDKALSEHTGYHSDDITTSENRIYFLREELRVKVGVQESEVLTLKSVPCMLSSSFIPDT